MTTDCLRLDDYLDGRLSEPDAESFETHTLTCAGCDAALDASAAIPELSQLREVACPPAVLEAALRSARRAPDRAAVPSARRRRFSLPIAALALVALLVVAIGLSQIGAPTAPEPVLAEADAASPDAAPTEPSDAPDALPEAAPLVADVAPDPPSPPPNQPPAEARPVAPAPRPAPAPPAPDVPEVAPDLMPDENLAQTTPTPEEVPTPEAIEAAQRDIALAFHLVAEAQTRAGDAIRNRTGAVSATIDQTLPF